tara:strand:+ start:1580 stop:2191 length:612 start_codon:yes stop_codon:yes gene_type:complete
MKLEIFIAGVTLLFIANIYYDGNIFKRMLKWTKYYQMIFVAFVGLCVYLIFKKTPQHIYSLCQGANSYIKYMPINKNTAKVMTPIIDFTKNNFDNARMQNYRLNDVNNGNLNNYSSLTPNQKRLLVSGKSRGGAKTKRSVSETKKKYVASQQNWKCKHCSCQLPAWFEVDHVVKLEYGGSNEINNLEALCRECHGKKTALENL